MHIVHVYKDYDPIPGGIENHIKWLARAQVQAGHRVTVLVTNPGREPARAVLDGVHVIRAARLATVASTPLSLTFPLLLARLKPDITHLHFPYPLGEVANYLVGRRRPTVITYHSDVVKQQAIVRLYGPLLRRVLRRADRVLPTSENYRQSSRFLRPLTNCTPIPLGIDPVPYLSIERSAPRAGTPTILFVGRHRYYKGVDDLIRAMPSVAARLIVAGDGPERARWEALADGLHLRDKVTFSGYVPDDALAGLYQSADIFCLPANARAEAFGLVLLEAMAAGLPCVTTELSTGTSFVVQDGVTGLVVPPQDSDALAQALTQLVDNSAERAQMGAAGRARVLTHFTIETMAQRVAAVYAQLLDRL